MKPCTHLEQVRTSTSELFGMCHELEGEEGFIFRVWAPHAEQIQVIGDFTGWFDEPLDMTKNHIGVWEATSALPEEGQLYKSW